MILGSLRGKLLAWPAGVGFDIFALLFLFIFFFFFGAVMMMLKIRRSLLESTWRCGFTGFCETQRPLGAECRMKKKGIGCCWVKVGSYACLLFHPWRAELEDKEDLLS